ncbi:methylenetetrahydrofolate reductase [Ornithinimicrobium cavernae]|uniref:methylenetetrahydrofolate reductase n=1 Tax=Ornithinimicrobium cavernae TaxID=2666047 RepID=UPI001F22A10A|nr:5,10-methylenetetrahydrofolate reductase [Ornithinimicrobium cavernae]
MTGSGETPRGLGARLADRGHPLRLFSITPPRETTTEADLRRIAEVTVERLQPLELDGLVLYDIENEVDRNPDERPFPYLPTLDPARFHAGHLTGWERPVIIYRSVGKYDPTELKQWLADQDPDHVATVLVGASSSSATVRTRLSEAQSLWRDAGGVLPLGSVAIPERHARRADEHERMLGKQQAGSSFFVTQVVYDLTWAKDLISDYKYACRERGTEPAHLVFTLSVCGSLKTLDFLQWLGVHVPRWLQNQLAHAEDPLAESYEQCTAMVRELADFCRRLDVPFGFNVESVSIRRVEIEASVRLAAYIRELLEP